MMEKGEKELLMASLFELTIPTWKCLCPQLSLPLHSLLSLKHIDLSRTFLFRSFQMLHLESKENQHPQKEGRDQEQDQEAAKDERVKGKSALSLTRNSTTVPTQSQNQNSTFHRSCQIELRQPVGSMSLSPGQ